MSEGTQQQTYSGIVKWFNAQKGYGFISREDGDGDIFVHYTGIANEGGGYRTLKEGDAVTFELKDNEKGPVARNVVVVSHQ